ncbi:hypothetical protein [Methylobacterium oryzisoli]|uniref:hypothetical protein n=1 Tax=Methylobacterium oryzisoli TaxID=3385502 RepID=UPI003891FD71
MSGTYASEYMTDPHVPRGASYFRKAALTINDTLLSRMLFVMDRISLSVVEAVEAARTIARNRWEELKRLLANPSKAAFAAELNGSDAFLSKERLERFTRLFAQVKSGRKPVRKPMEPECWSGEGTQARFRRSGSNFGLSLSSSDVGEFGS